MVDLIPDVACGRGFSEKSDTSWWSRRPKFWGPLIYYRNERDVDVVVVLPTEMIVTSMVERVMCEVWSEAWVEDRARGDGFLLTERPFCADTCAGMAHAHWLMTWFNVNGTRQNSPRSSWPSNPQLVPTGKTPNFVWKKKLRDLSPSKGFQFVSLSFPKVEKPRFLF